MENDIEQRIFKRIALINALPNLLLELSYHRDHRQYIALPGKKLWSLNDQEGRCEVT